MNRLKLTIATIAALLLSIAAVASDAVRIQSVGVSHTPDGIQIEIAGTSVLQYKSLHLTGPERLVIDLANSIPMKQQNILVNSAEASHVRVAQFQADPPVTRIVVDLGSNVKYDVLSKGTGVLVNLHASGAVAKAPATQAPAQKAQTASSGTQSAATPKPAAQSSSTKPATQTAAAHSSSTSPKLMKSAYKQPHASTAKTQAPKTPASSKDTKTQMASAKTHDGESTPVSEASSPEAQSAAMQSGDTAKTPNPDQPKDSAPATAQAKDAPAKDFVVADMKQAQPTTEADSAVTASTASSPSTTAAPSTSTAANAPMPSAPAPKPQTPAAPEPQPVKEAPATAATPAMVAANLAREQQQNMQAQRQTSRAKYTGAPYSFNLKDADLKDFFRAIAEITGLNIVLDPNVKGTLTLDLHDVPWDQALDIVLENNNLDKQLEGNVLRIATVETLRQEAEAQLAKEKAQALAVGITTYTHYLSYAHAKDVINTVKKLLSQRGDVSADDRTNAVIVRDIPSTIPEIQHLLIQLDRKTQQVEIEARVVAATRSFAREIGTQLGFGVAGTINGYNQTIGGTGAVGQTPTQVGYINPPGYVTIPGVTASTGTTPTVTPAGIPLFSNLPVIGPTSGIGATILGGGFRLDGILTMAENRGLLKVLSRPHVVTQNNVKAIVKQGVRVPVVTQAQLGGPPTVTYVDAFLQLTVTPQITAEGTIFLDVVVENTTPDFTKEVQGNPTLDTQAEQTQVLVSNGGTVQIGGVMLTNNTVHIDQVPLLGDIPILGNVFKHRQVSTQTQELIFFISPKIVES